MLGFLAALLAVTAGSFVSVVALATISGQDSHDLFAVVGLIDLYLTLASSLRLRFGSEGATLASHPHEAFLRALDMPRLIAVVSQVGSRIVLTVVLELALSLGVVAGQHAVSDSSPLIAVVAVLAAPFVSGAILVATAAGVATRRRSAGKTAVIAGGCLAVCLAATAGMIMSRLVSDGGWHADLLCPDFGVFAFGMLGVAGVGLVASGFSARRSIGRLGRESWSRWVEASALELEATAGSRRLTRWPFVGVIVFGRARRPIERVIGLVWIASATLIGFAVVNSSLNGVVENALTRGSVTVAFVLGLLISDLLLRYAGPISLGPHLRFAYEQGASPWILAIALVTAQLAIVVIVGAPVCVALESLGVTSIPFAAISVTCVGAGILASSVSTAARHNDRGETSGSPAAVILAVAVSGVAVGVSLLVPEPFTTPILIAVVVSVLGGALSCVRLRIVRRPLSAVDS